VTQIQTVVQPSSTQGPHGIPAHGLGGVYSPIGQQDIIDADSFEGPITLLSGTTDAIDPTKAGNYIIVANAGAGLDAMTIGTPRVGLDDNLSISIFSDTAFAHTLTAPGAIFAAGQALATVVTFKAFRGSFVTLRAWNGTWQVVGSNVTSFV
jgi:hypothetical protein